MLTAKQKKHLRENTSGSDLTVFKQDGTVQFKRAYFYRMGADADKFADRVAGQLAKAGFNATLVEARDAWAAWPKTSYFVARFEVTAKEAV